MSDLINAIKEKKQRILDLKREIQTLEAELEEAKSVLAEQPRRDIGRIAVRKRPIRPNSSVWWALRVLQHSKQPLHTDELVKRIEEFSGFSVRKTTLVSNLSRYVRSRDTFVRMEEGTYGLLESQDSEPEGTISVQAHRA